MSDPYLEYKFSAHLKSLYVNVLLWKFSPCFPGGLFVSRLVAANSCVSYHSDESDGRPLCCLWVHSVMIVLTGSGQCVDQGLPSRAEVQEFCLKSTTTNNNVATSSKMYFFFVHSIRRTQRRSSHGLCSSATGWAASDRAWPSGKGAHAACTGESALMVLC